MNDRFQDQLEDNASLLQRLAPSPLSRRRVLLGGSVAAVGLVAAACGGEDDPFVLEDDPDPALTTPPDTTMQDGGDDVATAKLAASLEVLAVNTYGAALGADLDYPPAVAEFATTVQSHHQAALDSWNQLLTSLGEQTVSEPPADLEATVNEQFAQVTDVPGVARLALMLEQIAADTYFAAIPSIGNAEALELAATIQPIDMQHAAILHYVLGEYPVPQTFADADDAVTA